MEFAGGKVEPGETKEQALLREHQDKLAIILSAGNVFMVVIQEYPDITIRLTVFNISVTKGVRRSWRTTISSKIPNYDFYLANEEI